MTTLGLLMLIIGAVGAWYLYKLSKKVNDPEAARRQRALKMVESAKAARSEIKLDNIGPGAVISLAQVGPNLEDFDARVTRRHLHKQGTYRWIEVEAERPGGIVYLSIDTNRGTDLSITLKELELDDLGVSLDQLGKMGHDEEGTFDFEGATYEYEESGQAQFCRDGNELTTETYDYIEFEAEGDQYVDVVRWPDGNVEVCYSVGLKPSQVTVYSVEEGS